jgi:succinyl-diaminopimelate desuccinylase
MSRLLNWMTDPVSLTQTLMRENTVNPPGNEQALCDIVEPLLHELGFQTKRYSFASGRDSVVAMPVQDVGRLLAFTGHLDTVPLGEVPWTTDPFGSTVRDGRLYGRGSSDMKGGIAAFLAALARLKIESAQIALPVVLVLTAGEETGCEGANALPLTLAADLPVEALLVGEPTANQMKLGHKGALWLKAEAMGRTAHASTPQLGDNAIYRAVDAISRLREFQLKPGFDKLLGLPTLNVGTIRGGININSVPDFAEFSIDIRTVGKTASDETISELASYLGEKIKLRATLNVPVLLTDASNAWMRVVERCIAEVTGHAEPTSRAAAFITDGPALQRIFGDIPTAILGPGEPGCAHITDEYIDIRRLRDSVSIYERIVNHQISSTKR